MRIKHDDFAMALEAIVGRMSAAEILAVPGVWELMAEALNNEAIASCERSIVKRWTVGDPNDSLQPGYGKQFDSWESALAFRDQFNTTGLKIRQSQSVDL